MQWLTNEKFGNGSSGALVISSNTTEAPIDATCTGTAGTKSLSATNVSFASNQVILIHQSRDTGAGAWELNVISSYVAGTITTKYALSNTYNTNAQVKVLPQYTNVTINNGVTYTAKAWASGVGGILAFLANGTVTITGTINANSVGFVGGATGNPAASGEGSGGPSQSATGNTGHSGGGGGGTDTAGGGGGNGTAGTTISGNIGGIATGTADLTTMLFGGSGGGGNSGAPGSVGGNGGGIIILFGKSVTITGLVSTNGGNSSACSGRSGGGGAGGSVLIVAQNATLGTGLITSAAGSAGVGTEGTGGAGGVGRVSIHHSGAITGTSSPTLNDTNDRNLGNVFFGGIV